MRPRTGPKTSSGWRPRVYAAGDQGAAISSGSFVTDGMIVVPCSMRTLGAIAHGFGDHLIHRAADVILKERRRLVLAVRETPFNDIHLENMLKLSRMGAIVARRCPPSIHGRRPSTKSSTGRPRGCSTRWGSTRNLHTGGTARWKPASNPDSTVNAETAETAEKTWLCVFSEFCVDRRSISTDPLPWRFRLSRRHRRSPDWTPRCRRPRSSRCPPESARRR